MVVAAEELQPLDFAQKDKRGGFLSPVLLLNSDDGSTMLNEDEYKQA
jgi:hypothetical protein